MIKEHKKNTQNYKRHARPDDTGTKEWMRLAYFAILLIIAIALLFPRLDGLIYFPGKYLWAEDGSVFLNQAQEKGFPSLWTPYAGYLHLYPRLIALVANYFELIHRPLIMLAGWFMAYIFMFFVLIREANKLDLGFTASLLLVILVSLQPNNGENFFNITNSQWSLGVCLSVLALTCTNESFQSYKTKLFLLILLGLTGPFSIILIPVLLLKAMLLKNFKNNSWVYLVVLACAVVQALVLMNSGRAAPVGVSTAPWDWFISFFQIALFGANTLNTMAVALLFWALLIYVIYHKQNFNEERASINILSILFLLTATLIILASQYSSKANPMAIVALGDGNRYTWVPFVLVMFGAILASNCRPILQIIFFILASFVCYKHFHTVTLTSLNLQFKSFAKFSEYRNVNIPIHPQWPTYPGWSINGVPSGNKSLEHINQINIDLNEFTGFGVVLKLSDYGLQIASSGNDPILVSNGRLICEKASDVALEIDIRRSSEGWMQLFFDQNSNFSEIKSIRRWYPAGLVKAQFAFPNEQDGIYIRFDPLELPGKVEIEKITAYCLP